MSATAVHRPAPVELRIDPAVAALPIGGWSKLMLAITAVMGTLAFCWPLILRPGAALTSSTLAPLLLAGILPLMLGLVVVQLANDRFAMVVSVNSLRPLRPAVLVFDTRVPREQALVLDLERMPDLGIRRSLKPALLPPAAREYLRPPSRICYFFERPDRTGL